MIQVSTTAAYALRAIVQLAISPDGSPMCVTQLSKVADVPQNYLAKILHQLARAGMLRSTRGRNGGFQIAIPLEDLSLLTIVRCFHDSAGVTCPLRREDCDASQDCPVHDQWRRAAETTERFLSETTVADLVGRS